MFADFSTFALPLNLVINIGICYIQRASKVTHAERMPSNIMFRCSLRKNILGGSTWHVYLSLCAILLLRVKTHCHGNHLRGRVQKCNLTFWLKCKRKSFHHQLLISQQIFCPRMLTMKCIVISSSRCCIQHEKQQYQKQYQITWYPNQNSQYRVGPPWALMHLQYLWFFPEHWCAWCIIYTWSWRAYWSVLG